MEAGTGTVVIRKAETPKFVIAFDGDTPTRIELDPLSVILKLKQSASDADEVAAMQAFRNAIGLPQLADWDTMQVMLAFRDFVADLQKKMPWMPK